MISNVRLIIPATLLVLSLAACTNAPAASSPTTPGATGNAVVPGNNSTVAGDKAGTTDTKTGQTSTGASGGGSGR